MVLVLQELPTNKEVQGLRANGFRTISSLIKELCLKIRPSEISPYFLESLKGIKIKNRTYYSSEDIQKIKDYLLLPKEVKKQNTKKLKYNNINYNNREKAKQTCLSNYGERFFLLTEKGKVVLKNIKEKYRDPILFQNIEKKRIQTCLKKYGVQSTNSVKEIQEKKEQTCLSNHGVRYGVLLGKNGKYLFDNILFDSSWELAYYFYLKENNIDFVYHPTDKDFFYMVDGKLHRYYPDFKVGEEYIEIKGEQFFSNNKLIQPYSGNLLEEVKIKNKFECMLKNNIKILRLKELKNILKFAKSKLGNLKSFKVEKNNC